MTLIPRRQDFRFRDWSTNSGAGWWIGALFAASSGPRSSIGSPTTFMMRPKVSRPTGTAMGRPVSIAAAPANQALGRIHRHRAHRVLAEMLRHFEHQPAAVVVDLQGVQDRRQFAVEAHVDHGADDLGDAPRIILHPVLPAWLPRGA